MSEFQTINYSLKNNIATIALNRPEQLNAFNTQLRVDFLAAVEKAEADTNVRLVIITGVGRGFSAGADVPDGLGVHDTIEEQILIEYQPIFERINDSSKIYIAAVNGVAAGIGAGYAMACDLCVMAEDSMLFFAFAGIALVTDGGVSYQLVKQLGYRKAMEFVLESRKLSASECLELGLTNKVAPAGEVLAVAQTWAEKLSHGAPLAVKYNKQLLKEACEADLATMIRSEAAIQNITITSKDHGRAAKAFMTKTTAVFQGD